MLKIAVLTPNDSLGDAMDRLARESGAFRVVSAGRLDQPHQVARTLRVQEPELVLLDLENWQSVSGFAIQVRDTNLRTVLLGFAHELTPSQEIDFAAAGVRGFVHAPFSASDLEAVAYDALHRYLPASSSNILAFLPAKAGSGCSTVTLNTAVALARSKEKRVLLAETDLHSGVLSFVLDLERGPSLSDALERAGELTALDWRQMHQHVFDIDILPAKLSMPDRLPSWGDFYQLLRFLRNEYDFLFFDLPEVVNPATAEVARAARAVFLVCTPELPSLKLADQRSAELRAFGIPAERILIILNRWERKSLKIEEAERILQHAVFWTIPNEYHEVKQAILQSRVASPESSFAKGCSGLAELVRGLPQPSDGRFSFSQLRKEWWSSMR